mmetsp:Transcript_52305/g.124799  ORF Transcript_52305/g.124799 Transcript_52305/m.124799 type:complete len:213 (-) Transcript_52305:122-760(-)
MRLSMLKKPLFRPGLREALIPQALMNSGCTLSTSAGVHPVSPRISKATKPLDMTASESPANSTVPSSFRVADTCTVLRQPGTLFASIFSSSAMAGSLLASASSCWYRILSFGSACIAFMVFASFGGRPKSSSAAACSATACLIRLPWRRPRRCRAEAEAAAVANSRPCVENAAAATTPTWLELRGAEEGLDVLQGREEIATSTLRPGAAARR